MSDEGLYIDVRLDLGGFSLKAETGFPARGVSAVFGPSGAGKSLLLRVIAGFETPREGVIRFGGTSWFDSVEGINLPAWKRPVGFLFQDGRLFDHLDVAGNLDFAHRRARAPGVPSDELIEALDLSALLTRRVRELSGGERQRVALARTLLSGPELLLLDEPLSALDRARKREILPYLERVVAMSGIPAIYVSHDPAEVLRLSHHIVLLEGGAIRAAGSTHALSGELYRDASPGERLNVLDGYVSAENAGEGLAAIDTPAGRIEALLAASPPPGSPVRLLMAAQDIAIALVRPAGTSIRNILPARVQAVTENTDSGLAIVTLDLTGTILHACISQSSASALGLGTGKSVFALVKSVRVEI